MASTIQTCLQPDLYTNRTICERQILLQIVETDARPDRGPKQTVSRVKVGGRLNRIIQLWKGIDSSTWQPRLEHMTLW